MSMTSRRHLHATFVAFLIVIACGMATSPVSAGDLPPDAAALLPPSPVMLAAFSSLDEADQSWLQLTSLGGKAADSPPKLPSDLVTSLAEMLMPYVDRTRPASVAVGFMPTQADNPVTITVVLPLLEKARDPYFLRRVLFDMPLTVRGGYAAVSTDANYAPGGSSPALGTGLPDGALAARVDLAQIYALMGPEIEAVLREMAIPAASSPADSAGVAAPAMSPEQSAATAAIFRTFIQAARRLDLAMTLGDGNDVLRGTLAVHPGSAFDLGPQPDHSAAVALTKYLSPELPVVQASAVEGARLVNLFAPFLRAVVAPMPDPAYNQWMVDGLELGKMWAHPCAAGVSFAGDAMHMQMIVAVPEPETVLEATIAYYRRLESCGAGMVLGEGGEADVDGVRVRTFSLEPDPQWVARQESARGNSGAAAIDSVQIMKELLGYYPPYRVAVVNGLVAVCCDRDPAAMGALLARIKSGEGVARPEVVVATQGAGAGTNSVVVGEFGAVFDGILKLMQQATNGRIKYDGIVRTEPTSFVVTSGVRGQELDFALEIDIESILELGKAFTAAAMAGTPEGGQP
jgi:hypothetical protein